ncbi:MAG: CRTAC1 family protein [Candidatus Marinimicrobia bacterium]|nr:CRTAC1 family protein [Candidatus Neomarinimicrobiota bacterium]
MIEKLIGHMINFVLVILFIFSLKNIGLASEIPVKIYLEDRTDDSGIDFIHYAPRPRWCEIGPSVVGTATNEGLSLVFEEEKEFWRSNNRLLTMDEFANVHLIKMNGSGGAWLDYDLDGDWDLYLVNCQGEEADITNSLYENLGDGKFIKATDTGTEDIGEGMSVSVADYDNDGDSDLFITNYGDFKLFRNNGDKTFSDVSTAAFPEGIKDWWYGGSTWGDYDLDGDLDLYVAGYVDFARRPQYTSLRFPMDFGGLPNTLYRNNGDGTFQNVTPKLNILTDASRKSMQVLFHDFNEDGFPDLFVANDTDANGFYLNRGDGTFKVFSGPSGLSTTDGSMGIALGDMNNDGMTDIVYTNYAAEVNTLAYLIDNNSSNDGKLKNAVFTHSFDSPMVHKLSWPNISWGPGLFDLDNDGDLDLFFANGHLNSVSGDNRQFNLLFENGGKGFYKNISESSGILATGKRIHRSAMFADYDNDGKIDMFVTVNGQQIEDGKGNTIFDPNQGKGILLKNKSRSNNSWVTVRLEGNKSNRDGFGALVTVQTNKTEQRQSLVSGQGYFSNHAKELYFGLGKSKIIDSIEVKWPSGLKQTFKEISPNQTVYILEGDSNYLRVESH